MKEINLKDLIADERLQVRALLDGGTIDEYAQNYEEGADMPPLDVFLDGNKYLVADGFHRHRAAAKAKLKALDCIVHTGRFDDALKFALGANSKHGLRRSNEDKQRAVELALAQWPTWSSREVGVICRVDRRMVDRIRSLMADPIGALNRRGDPRPASISETQTKAAKELRSGALNYQQPSKTSPNGPPPKPKPQRPEKPPPEQDDLGTVIPAEALPFWHRRAEIQEMLTTLSRLKVAVADAKKSADPMFGKVSNGCIDDLARAYTHLKEALPHAVCTTCMGSPSTQARGCAMCGNKGLISKWQWDTQSRAEVKQVRLKANALRA